MVNAKSQYMGSLKEYIEELEERFGGLRAAGEALDIDWQRLQYYKKSGEKLQAFLQFLDKSRKATRKSKSAVWDALIKEPEKK